MANTLKAKTNKAVSKRYKKTASGKYLAKQAGLKHINAKMSSKRKRRLGGTKVLKDCNTKRLPLLLPHS
ncbi:MAG: 50S ribosomal protein L35 [Candidatus Caenarcaniphilales bacterium]|nr:50S ribosomal protein L35 [Candidatus Caenarcaniphilales bacterium]